MLSIWRPTMPESIDGTALATNLSDLHTSFPYHRLTSNPVLDFLLRPEGVIVMLIFYLVSKSIVKELQKSVDPKARWFIASIAVHNFGLAVFSAIVAYNTWPIFFGHWYNHGLFDTLCDLEGTLWSSGFGSWATIFYVSKYYEFIDTWILILKGKKPSFLQVYHHMGIAVCMWLGIVSHSAWLLQIVLYNSVIHTLMYTYFFIKTIDPKIEIKSAKYLTMAQIGQFFIGISGSSTILTFGDSCNSVSSRFGLAVFLAYGSFLAALFIAFAQRKYKVKTK